MEKTRKKKIFKCIKMVILAFCIIVGIISFSEPMETKAAGKTLEDLQNKFPGGKYWNHATQDGHDIDENRPYYHHGPCNNPDGYTSYPCTDHNIDIRGAGYYDCNWLNGLQCYGFVCKLSDDVYGDSNPMAHWGKVSIDNAKAGDVIQFNSGLVHYAMIIGRNGTTVTLGECNYDYHCRIDWERKFDVSGVSSKSYQIYSAPSELLMTSQPQGSLISGGSRVISDGDYHIVSAIGGGSCINTGNYCLTIGGLPDAKDSNANAELWSVFGVKDHVFTVTWQDDGFYQIKLKDSQNKCLDVEGGNLSRGANAWQYEIINSNAQKWRIDETGDGTGYTIRAKCSGYYLDAEDGKAINKTNIRLWEGNGSNAEKWYFIP